MTYTELKQNFFGQTEILSVLKKRVTGLKDGYRQNVALLGSQYVGKSTILHQFIANLDEEDVTVIYLDLENKDFSYFFSKFIGSLLYNFSKNAHLPLHDDLTLLLESTGKLIPQTNQVIKKIRTDFINGKMTEVYQGLLTLPEIFTNETGKFCVLIFDEFQNLDEFMIPNAFQDLGKKIMTQKRCFYIISSSYQGVAKRILSEKMSLLFGNFEIIHVESFDSQACQEFINSNLKELNIGAQLRNFLTDFAGGHPLCLHLICQELVNLSAIHKQGEVYLPILSQAVENTIFERWGVLSRHFELIVNELCNGKGNRVISSLLMSLANGKHKIDELVSDTGIKKNFVLQKMTRLLELGVIVKNGNFYCFKDKLFKYWIKFVYQKRLKDVELAPDKQRKQFKEDFNRAVEDFKNNSRKDFPCRIMELLHCFDNEAFNLNGRRYKLPAFRKIVSAKVKNEVGNYFDVIKASTNDAQWLVVLKKDSLGESDVNFVLSEAKKQGQKPQRCLIISLTDLDQNTKLKALQERFWVWNESELNTLLTLFDKPYILR